MRNIWLRIVPRFLTAFHALHHRIEGPRQILNFVRARGKQDCHILKRVFFARRQPAVTDLPPSVKVQRQEPARPKMESI